jgi:hypothetical protein
MTRHAWGSASPGKSAQALVKAKDIPEQGNSGAELVHFLCRTRKFEPDAAQRRLDQDRTSIFGLSLGVFIMLQLSDQVIRQPDSIELKQSLGRTLSNSDIAMSMLFYCEHIRNEKQDVGVRTSRRLPEVVRVFARFQLIDAESYQRTYSRKDHTPLPLGYYVVTWPHGMEEMTYGNVAKFEGPYRIKRDAEFALVS